LAGIVKSADVVFVQVPRGRELLLKPGLNIIGGVQPRGLSEVIDCDVPDMPNIPDILDMLDMPDMPDMGGMLDILDMLDMLDMGGMLDIVIMDEEAVDSAADGLTAIVDVDASPIVIACIDMPVAVLDPSITILFGIPDIVIEAVSTDVPTTSPGEESSPSPVPAWRM